MAPDGICFYMKCCAHGASGKEIGRKATDAYQDCMTTVPPSTSVGVLIKPKVTRPEAWSHSTLVSSTTRANTPTSHAANDAHDTAYTIDPTTADHPNQASVMCSTERPYANGQQYESKYGEVCSQIMPFIQDRRKS